MKIFFVSLFLAASLAVLIISMDMILGTRISQLFSKLKKPFEVPEPSEYAVIALFLAFIIIKAIAGYFKKKKGNNSSTN